MLSGTVPASAPASSSVAACSSVRPVPAGPAGPAAPTAPSAPAGPVGPDAPAGPVGPTGPSEPAQPAKPIASSTPTPMAPINHNLAFGMLVLPACVRYFVTEHTTESEACPRRKHRFAAHVARVITCLRRDGIERRHAQAGKRQGFFRSVIACLGRGVLD